MNEETWKFLNQYLWKVWYLSGLLSAPLSVMAIALVLGKGTEGVLFRVRDAYRPLDHYDVKSRKDNFELVRMG